MRTIVEYPAGILMSVSNPVVAFDDSLLELIADLKRLCEPTKAFGLAANQVGDRRRVIVFFNNQKEHQILINPVIVEASEEKILDHEGCMSLPGLQVNILRSKEITVTGQNEQFEEHTWIFEDVEARVVQHEVDHLNGILITDHKGMLNRKMALDKWLKNYNKYVRRQRTQIKEQIREFKKAA
jgi:peptide deformylase